MPASTANPDPEQDYRPNHLDWPGCLNVRDVGGMPTTDGRTIAERALVRADRLSRLTNAGIAAFRAYGVGRIIDLRREAECEREPSPFAGEPIYHSIPVQNPEDPDHEWLDLAGIYIAMLDLRPDLYSQAVAEVADAPQGAVVVHCAGGKDRTGLIVAFALAVAGVSRELIAADYALTEDRLAEEALAAFAQMEDRALAAQYERLRPTPPENMYRVFDHLDAEYGGPVGYLEKAGLSTDRLTALRDRLLH